MSEHQSHDTGYKYLFSHAELVQELIEGFAPAELLPLLDFNSLTPVQGSYITPSMKSKEEDAVWRINMGDKPLYLYLLLEFQSSVDATMPVRMLQYVGALYESLIKANTAHPTQLPPVLPIVLYNGDQRWKVATDISVLIDCPSVLKPFQPRQRYLLLDEGAYDENELMATHNIVAGIFAVENTADHQQAYQVLLQLSQFIQSHPAKARIDKAVTKWAGYYLQRHHPEIIIDETSFTGEASMLATNVEKWAEGFKQEGMQQGIRQGIRQGVQQGKTGMLKGILAMRFPNADLTHYQRAIESAAEDELMRYTIKAATVSHIEEVFKD